MTPAKATGAKEILQRRATELAREPAGEDASEETLDLTEFVLANERYGIPLVHLREIYPLKDLTPLPCTPPFIRGIVNVRGQILTVIDLRKFFDLPDRILTDLSKILILQAEDMECGILADEVAGVRSVRIGDVQPSLPTLTGIRAEYLRGVTSERLVILDVPGILADEKILVSEQVQT